MEDFRFQISDFRLRLECWNAGMLASLLAFTLANLMDAKGERAVENPITNPGFEELDERGFPKDWSPVGGPPDSVIDVVTDAHSGKNALRLKRLQDTKRETGLNRWYLAFSGQQGAMLSQLKGGVRFWYKAVSAKGAALRVYIIPMSEKPLEDTGVPRAFFEVPEEHVGDGRWHLGAVRYDFTSSPKVKWIEISPRIVGGTGEILLDDFEWVEMVGALPQVTKLTLEEDPERPGEACTVTAEVKNVGDAEGIIQLQLRSTSSLLLTAEPAEPVSVRLASNVETSVSWRLLGRREGEGKVIVSASGGDVVTGKSLPLQPVLEISRPTPDALFVDIGESTAVRIKIKNKGNASAKDVTVKFEDFGGASLKLLEGLPEQTLPLLAPNQETELSWKVQSTVVRNEIAAARVEVHEPGKPTQSFPAIVFAVKHVPKELREAKPQGKLKATRSAHAYTLENEHLRIIFPDWSDLPLDSPTAIEIQVNRQNRWTTVAKMGWLSRWVYQDSRFGWGHTFLAPTPATSCRVQESDQTAKLTLTQVRQDSDGVHWHLTCEFEVSRKSKLIKVLYRLSASQPRKLLYFEGPMLFVGAGSFGGKKGEAIFPGLEWLEGKEISSSDLDIAASHPDRFRFVPHPNKITIPCMGVYHDGIAVGVLWDALQKWDGENDRPGALFVSPDWLAGQNVHTIGLFLPSVGKWVKENVREPLWVRQSGEGNTVAYELTPQRPITLTCQIMLDPNAKDALAVVDHWFAANGVPAQLKPPRGDWRKEVAFSLRAYLDSLWIEKEQAWWTMKGGHPSMSHPTRSPAYCFDVLAGAVEIKDMELKQKAQERARLVLGLTGAKPQGDDLGFTWGNPLSALMGMTARAGGLLQEMGEDGAWRFNANRKGTGVFEGLDYRILGPHNAAELGTCARNAYEVLRYATLTGDEEAFEAAKKSLEFMKRFKVPRAAQVWEVPVHTPDILAAADAIEAYLEAYRFTGDRTYLQEATRWARAGLPFVYVWNVPEFKFMRYATIPVFGASWFQASWFGRPVQWIGLRYAYALFKLSEDESRFPWQLIAEGITISALYQQDTSGENIALWPDSISCIDGSKGGPFFSPSQILKNVFWLLGVNPEPRTMVLRKGKQRLHLSMRGVFNHVDWKGGRLSLDAILATDVPTYLLICPVNKPTAVKVDGKSVPLVGGASSPDAAQDAPPKPDESPHWFYSPSHAFLFIRLNKTGAQKVEVSGISFRPVSLLPKPVNAISFEFDQTTEGWLAANHVEELKVQDGKLVGKVTGVDPYLERPSVHVRGDDYPVIVVRMRHTGGTQAQIYWTTDDSPQWGEDKVVRFEVIPDGQWHDYRVPMHTHPLFSGKRITKLRFDPTSNAPGSTFEVDFIRGG